MVSSHNFTNQQIAKLLRSVAAALAIKKGSIFQLRAYETAADAIEHSTSEVKDLWEEEKLDQIPGVGQNIAKYLDELFRTGKIAHFESIQKGIEPVVFDLLDIPGVGPKTALELSKLGIKSLEDLHKKLNSGELTKKGLSDKIASKITLGLKELSGRTGRMLLPYAAEYSKKILDYLKKCPEIKAADALGSLRRQVATIGDLDFAAASKDPSKVVKHFVNMPNVKRIIDQGENQPKAGTKKGAKATVVLASGLHLDLLVGSPNSYGALLQHFTGSKNHNVRLRTLAEKKGYSLSENGIKSIKSGKITPTKTEEELYKLLGMDTPEPELREDNGEIEAALDHKLPKLIEFKDINGDLHLHSNFPMVSPSHGPGANSIEEIIEQAIKLGYSYVGISDHPPGYRTVTLDKVIKILQKRTKLISRVKSSKKVIRVLNGLEVDILPDGTLSVPDSILEGLDYCIAGIHSGHRSSSEDITKRIISALKNPNVDIISHPTGRLLNERDSYEADWEQIFKFSAKNKKLLEINAYPNRLDLRDDLVKLAISFGCKFIIDSDAHETSQMSNMPYGVAVARRGWATKDQIVNSWEWKKFANWFNIKR